MCEACVGDAMMEMETGRDGNRRIRGGKRASKEEDKGGRPTWPEEEAFREE